MSTVPVQIPREVLQRLTPLLGRHGTSPEVTRLIERARGRLEEGFVTCLTPPVPALRLAIAELQGCVAFIRSSAVLADRALLADANEALASLMSVRPPPVGAPVATTQRERPTLRPLTWLNVLTPVGAAATVLRDLDGREVVVVVAKATFQWDANGAVVRAAEDRPVQEVDAFHGDPARSSLAAASELGLPKPRVDVLLQGELVLPQPAEQIDVALEVGGRVRKVARVFGDRAWVSGPAGRPTPTRPLRFQRMPLQWERAYGGEDPRVPGQVELANPVGMGFATQAAHLEGARVPNFEPPGYPVEQGRASPVGFGPIAPHWRPRRDLAGTYDERWKEQRFPLLPLDFDPRHHNVAPTDQQLDEYRVGEAVRLTNMTPARVETFYLPAFPCPLSLVDDGYLLDREATVDTVVIEPAARTFTLTARYLHVPRRDVLGVKTIFVGELSRGRRRAIVTGKPYVRCWGRHREKL